MPSYSGVDKINIKVVVTHKLILKIAKLLKWRWLAVRCVEVDICP